MEHNAYERCTYVDKGRECGQYFLPSERNKFCPFHNHHADKVPSLNPPQENHKERWNKESAACHEMTYEQLEAHLKEREQNLQSVLETLNTQLSAIRAVKADRIQKMTLEQRRELQKHKVPRTNKPTNKQANKPTNGLNKRAAKIADQFGISIGDLLTVDPDNMEAFKQKYQKSKESE